MKYSPHIHHRRSIRLKRYDYSQNGAYFVTICVQNRKCLFGKIENGEMVLNDAGKIIEKYWQEIPEHYPNVILDAFVIMPNHMQPQSSGQPQSLEKIQHYIIHNPQKWQDDKFFVQIT